MRFGESRGFGKSRGFFLHFLARLPVLYSDTQFPCSVVYSLLLAWYRQKNDIGILVAKHKSIHPDPVLEKSICFSD